MRAREIGAVAAARLGIRSLAEWDRKQAIGRNVGEPDETGMPEAWLELSRVHGAESAS